MSFDENPNQTCYCYDDNIFFLANRYFDGLKMTQRALGEPGQNSHLMDYLLLIAERLSFQGIITLAMELAGIPMYITGLCQIFLMKTVFYASGINTRGMYFTFTNI